MNTNEDLLVPPKEVTKHFQPWEKIKWRDDQVRAMYRAWCKYFSKNTKINVGTHYFDEALKLKADDPYVLINRSQTKRRDARAMEALADCQRAKAIHNKFHPNTSFPEMDFETCDALFESNQFEETEMLIHSSVGLLSVSQGKAMWKRSRVVKSIFNDVLSNETVNDVHNLINKMLTEVANEPKYEKPDCDILSIMEKQEIYISPLEEKRRQRLFKVYNQSYLQSTWKDILFLKELRGNPDFLLKQCVESSGVLGTLLEEKYQTVRRFTKMLHTRLPMYALFFKRYPNKELYKKQQQANFFRIQYQTRRNMFKVLQTIRIMILTQELGKLCTYVEEVMGSYVSVKTHRIMPWNFEFINEVYNYLGMALIKEYKIPSQLRMLNGRARLVTLLNIPQEFVNPPKVKSTNIMNIRREKTVDSTRAELFKQRMAHLEKRMRFAKHTIELSYLYYMAAQANLENHSFDTCCLLARKSIDEARKGNHYVWAALSALVACKAHTVLGKLENQKKMFGVALKFAKRLKDIDLMLFIDICLKVSTEGIELKKSLMAGDGSIKRGGRRSMTSLDASIDSSPNRSTMSSHGKMN